MKTGDQVLFYHSITDKAVIGLARVSRPEYPDPTDEKWICVELTPVAKFPKPVTLQDIKGEKSLGGIALIKQSRLSVMPLTKGEFDRIIKLSEL
jgi:predicted RNA-binding protein with PUA-like domain